MWRRGGFKGKGGQGKQKKKKKKIFWKPLEQRGNHLQRNKDQNWCLTSAYHWNQDDKTAIFKYI